MTFVYLRLDAVADLNLSFQGGEMALRYGRSEVVLKALEQPCQISIIARDEPRGDLVPELIDLDVGDISFGDLTDEQLTKLHSAPESVKEVSLS